MQLLAHFVDQLASTPDGDGTLLDHTVLLYGSGMSDSHLHLFRNLPTVVVHGTGVGIQGNRHIKAADGTPFTNLQMTLLDKLNLPVERFGDSNGELNLVTEV